MIAATRIAYPRLPPIHLDFADVNQVNAFAFVYETQHFIGVTRGAVLTTALLFERMLSDRRILMHIGNAKGEIDRPPLALPLADALLLDNLANGPKGPTDQSRKVYCGFLTQMAFAFLFSHELAHILHGHVDRNEAMRRSPFMAEFGSPPITQEQAIESQLLEMDADTSAIAHGVGFVERAAINPPCDIPKLVNYEGILFAWLFAVFSFFRIFGDNLVVSADLYKTKHPPLRLRVGHAWWSACTNAKHNHGREIDRLVPVVWRAASSVERAFQFLTGQKISPPTRYTEAFAPTKYNRDHKNRLMKRWNEGLRQELLTYAYEPPMIFDASSSA